MGQRSNVPMLGRHTLLSPLCLYVTLQSNILFRCNIAGCNSNSLYTKVLPPLPKWGTQRLTCHCIHLTDDTCPHHQVFIIWYLMNLTESHYYQHSSYEARGEEPKKNHEYIHKTVMQKAAAVLIPRDGPKVTMIERQDLISRRLKLGFCSSDLDLLFFSCLFC